MTVNYPPNRLQSYAVERSDFRERRRAGNVLCAYRNNIGIRQLCPMAEGLADQIRASTGQ